ncbi:hypothetical protein AV530_011290 [Patagioenas fasciata monilis]|uniref:Uncharacterized protein n=1 Tax=Patagioenas fasciata monilis TaxID=372326 RepID=A0A1V4KQQ5_PATFA|nr:hypothetical protein AV530_011290 [Patagioenas fasciata monilis]
MRHNQHWKRTRRAGMPPFSGSRTPAAEISSSSPGHRAALFTRASFLPEFPPLPSPSRSQRLLAEAAGFPTVLGQECPQHWSSLVSWDVNAPTVPVAPSLAAAFVSLAANITQFTNMNITPVYHELPLLSKSSNPSHLELQVGTGGKSTSYVLHRIFVPCDTFFLAGVTMGTHSFSRVAQQTVIAPDIWKTAVQSLEKARAGGHCAPGADTGHSPRGWLCPAWDKVWAALSIIFPW